MPLRVDLLAPIAGANPSGGDIRYDSKLGFYDQIKEARRQDDGLAQGAWQHERKTADYLLTAKLGQEILAAESKDLQVAAWLTEAMLHIEGFAGLRQGLELCHGLLQNFWDTVYPPLDDELRAAPLNWMGSALETPLKSTPLVRAGYDWFKYKDSRLVGYEEQAKTDKEKKARAKMISEGKLAPEVFDKAFAETPKAFYQESEKDLGSCVTSLKAIDTLCNEKFGDEAPSFGRLRIALEEVLHTVHTFLEKKRETEPDPVISSDVKDASGVAATQPAGSVAQSATIGISVLTSSEPADRREAVATVARVAASLRQKDPYNPAPYLLMRGLRWGELRSKLRISDLRLLEAPPTELRQHVKRLALDQKWAELLETCENAMSLPCGRAWLDMQRLVVTACSALGSEYAPVASAICSELRTLMNDIPELADANLLDDTPAANHETKAWLKQLNEPSAWPSPVGASESDQLSNNGNNHTPPWLARATDPYVLAQDALKAEQAPRAFDIMRKEIDRQRSGRGRFERTMQLAQLCVQAGKDTIAQPLLDDLAAAIDTHKLDDWEDPELVASALVTLMKFSKKLQSNATERQKMFERICRLDPSQALGAG